MQTKSAAEIRKGDRVCERDGYVWTVSDILKETPTHLTLLLTSDFSMVARRIEQRVSKRSRVYVVEG